MTGEGAYMMTVNILLPNVWETSAYKAFTEMAKVHP